MRTYAVKPEEKTAGYEALVVAPGACQFLVWAVAIAVTVCIVYGQLLISGGITIDTEDIINLQMSFYGGWLGIDRYGLVFTKAVFGLLSNVPVLATSLSMVTMVACGIVWMLLITQLGMKKSYLCGGIFSLLLVTSVPLLEILAFQCLSFEVAFALLLAALSLSCFWKYIDERHAFYLALHAILLVWVFSSYQAFIPMAAAMYSLSFLVRAMNGVNSYEKKNPGRTVLIQAAFFALALLLYKLLGTLLIILSGVQEGSYTSSMVVLGKEPIGSVLNSFALYLLGIFSGNSYAWNYLYLLAYISLFVFPMLNHFRSKGGDTPKVGLGWILIAILFSLCAPLVLPFVTGGGVVRGQFALPFVMALSIALAISETANYLSHIIMRRAFMILAAVAFLHVCIAPGVRLMWTNSVVKQQEIQVTYELLEDIHAAGGKEGSTVIVLGQWHPSYNRSMVPGEVLGRSFFEWDAGVQGGTNRRVLGYWRTLGYDFAMPTLEEIQAAEAVANGKPSFPDPGAVWKTGNIIVVKLSD